MVFAVDYEHDTADLGKILQTNVRASSYARGVSQLTSLHNLRACACPPRSNVVNLTLPMLSSSEVGCRVGWRTATLSFLSMCSNVVFPALSRPRKRSLAFLFVSPREARTSAVYVSTC